MMAHQHLARGEIRNRVMYKYEEPSIFSGPRGAALIAVILLHVVIVWAFYTGLAGKLIQKVIPPVEIAQIDKPKDVDKPPPPPPKLEEIKPFVPPPEFVDIQAPQQQTNAITETTQVQKAPAPVASPAATTIWPDRAYTTRAPKLLPKLLERAPAIAGMRSCPEAWCRNGAIAYLRRSRVVMRPRRAG